MTFYKWLQVSGSNANADATINWAEGQAPSTVNDSARAMMAATAKYRDDISGAIVTAGTSTAYTVSSYEVFDTLTHLGGQMVAFTPHVTNGATVTLNVDGLGPKPLRTSANVELQSGVLIQGTPYVTTYNSSDGAFYLHGFYGASPYLVPLGGIIDYTGTTAPNSNFVLPFGQAISRTTYATYFAMVNTTFGNGDGTTTFNVPDLRGVVVAGKDDMGGSARGKVTNAGSGIAGTTLGAGGGAQNQTLLSGQIPNLNSSGSNSISVTSTVSSIPSGGGSPRGDYVTPNSPSVAFVPGASTPWNISGITSTGSNSINVSYTNTSQSAVTTMPPTIVLNKILRIL